jgi:hypothetical protein
VTHSGTAGADLICDAPPAQIRSVPHGLTARPREREREIRCSGATVRRVGDDGDGETEREGNGDTAGAGEDRRRQ